MNNKAGSTFFTTSEHQTHFETVVQQIGKVYGSEFDPEYSAALYILTSSRSTWEKAQDYVSSEGIDFEALLLEIDFSGAYSVIIHLASNLFNGNAHVNPVELMRLDERNFMVALTAILLRRYGYHKDEDA